MRQYTFNIGQTVECYKWTDGWSESGRHHGPGWQCIGFGTVAALGDKFVKVIKIGDKPFVPAFEWLPIRCSRSYLKPI